MAEQLSSPERIRELLDTLAKGGKFVELIVDKHDQKLLVSLLRQELANRETVKGT